MKNLKVYKRVLSLLTASSLVLLCGCSFKSNTNNAETLNQIKTETCTHLTVYFEDEPITFKECEGYKINSEVVLEGGYLKYNILKDDTAIISSGRTTRFNRYVVDHEISDKIFNNESIQKLK